MRDESLHEQRRLRRWNQRIHLLLPKRVSFKRVFLVMLKEYSAISELNLRGLTYFKYVLHESQSVDTLSHTTGVPCETSMISVLNNLPDAKISVLILRGGVYMIHTS